MSSFGDETSRRRSRIVLGLIAAAALVVLALTAAIQLRAPADRSVRVSWAVISITVTVLLLSVFYAEIVRRIRGERAVALVDEALAPSGQGPVEPDDRPLGQQLNSLAESVAGVISAPSVTVLLDDETTPSRQPAASGLPSAPDEPYRVDLICEGVRIGALEVRAEPGRRLSGDDRLVLAIMAPRVAAQAERARLAEAERRSRLEAEQARRQVNVLARASVPLAPGLENPEETISELADIVVPEFADLFAVDLVRPGGGLKRIAVASGDPTLQARFDEVGHEYPAWQDTLRRVMADGESELAFSIGTDTSPDDDHGAFLYRLGMQSWVVAPIRVRDTSIGTMTLATSRTRRGYRPSDLVTIDDLVARSAIAFERGLLYREARQAATEASRRANQLARMVESMIVLTRTLASTELLDALVEQAASVLGAPRAHVQYDDQSNEHHAAEFGAPLSSPAQISRALVGPRGEPVGRLTVERPEGFGFAADDGAVVRMLAEAASVALRNAELYQDARHREQRLQALIEASPLAILEIDRTGAVLVANPVARALFPASAPGTGGLVQIPAELDQEVARLLADTIGGQRREVELSTTDDAGERRDLLVATAPVSGEGLDSVRMLAVISDMTGRKRLEEQLATAQRFEAIATLAGGVAHDFNNLLTVILGYSEILLHGLDQTAPDRESVEAIQEAGNHAAVITNQLLTLSRHQVLQPETIDVVERTAALVPMLRRLAGANVEIDTRLTGSARIKVDPGQLEQVLFNLVFNSRDAMPRGGHLSIEVGLQPPADGPAAVFVRVSDDGEGMDAETLARCQEPFFTTKSRSRGIGLGLATVASILERSGGTLQMTSEVGRGTSSTVLFPSVGAPRPETEAAPGCGQGRVLLVDDDEQVRRFAARVLAGSGYVVTEVPDGESAIREMEVDSGYDLLVTDVELPAMSGAVVVHTSRRRWPAIACLLITGYAEAHSLDVDIGDTMLVPKPFTPEELVRAAGGALKTARSAAGPAEQV